MDKLLLVIKVPPPVTGATLMNQRVLNNPLLSDYFNVESICMSYATSVDDLGRIKFGKIRLMIKYLNILNRKLRRKKYSFVYFQLSLDGLAFFRDLLFVFVFKLYKTKILYHLRGKGIQQRSGIIKMLFRYAFRSETVIILSDLLRYDIKNIHFGDIYIIPNGLPSISTFSNSRVFNGQTLNILFMANLLFTKGVCILFEVIKMLFSRGIDFKVLIIGAEGDFTAKDISDFVHENKLFDRVEYFGALYGDEKYKVISMSDILVNPTLKDIWGNVNIEAMQFGKPVIASDEGAIRDIIDDGNSGFIVDKGAAEQFVEKIEILYHNPSLLRRMGEKSRKIYESRFRIEQFNENIKDSFIDFAIKIKEK